MEDFLYGLDKAVFLFVNQTLSTTWSDAVWPIVTGYDTVFAVRVLLLLAWLGLLVRGGTRGRTVALLLVPTVIIADQLNSTFIKEWVGRMRPCGLVDGVPVVSGIHLLVPCGSGMSFCSSHAVTHFAIATVIATHYRRWAWPLGVWAGLVAVSRVAVGVHYPSDVVAGALLGVGIAVAVVTAWTRMQRAWWPPPPVTEPRAAAPRE